MSKNLHLVPKMPLGKDQKFDKAMGCLTLSKAGFFTVEITPTEGFYKEAPEKLPPFKKRTQEEVWKMPDIDDRKRYVANHKKREKKEAQYAEERDAFNEKLRQELTTLSWSWELVGNGMNGKTITHHTDFAIGMPKNEEKQIFFPEIIVGGGFAWLEVFTNNDPPTGKAPHGLFIRATGIPEIIRVAWTDLDCKPITAPVKFGSKVLLNIYTKHMYGQDLEVGLWDKDTVDPDDLLPISNKDNFTTEALIHKLLPNEINKSGISGGIKVDKKTEAQVQKVRIPVLVDHKWMSSAGNQLKIYPTVKSKETDEFLKLPQEDCFLEVALKGKMHETVIEPTNNPLLIGKVETNIASFRPCRYDTIKGSYAKKANRENNEALEIEIFNSKTDASKQKLIMPVIAGVREARRDVKIVLDTKTDECLFINDKMRTHKGKVIDLSLIQNSIVIENTTRVDEHLIFSENKLKIGRLNFSKEEEGHEDTNDDNEISASHTSGNSRLKSIIGVSSTSNSSLYKDKKTIGKYPNSDTEVVLDIGFDYGNESVVSLLKYIWPLRQSVLQHYPIILQTCCFTKQLDIAVYPDIKWVLQFSYDCDPEEFQNMRNEKYDEYLVRIEELDEKLKPKKIASKINKIDQDIANANLGLSEAKKKDKEKFKKLIAKLNERKKEQLNIEKKYNKGKSKAKKQYKEDRPDLFSFKDNVESGLSDLVLSLNVEYDRPGKAIEISASYKRYINLVKQIIEVTKMIELILDGKKKSKKKLDKKLKEIDEEKASEQFAKIGDALKGRPLFSFDVIPPSLAILGSWYAENPKDINTDQVGIVGEIQILAKPLIGASIMMDFLALAQKAHPIARGIITLIDVGAAMGVAPEINVNLEVSGQLEISGMLRYNSASGTTNLNQQSLTGDAEDDSPLTVNGVFGLKLEANIKSSKKFNYTILLGTISAYVEAGVEIVTGFTLSGAIKADDKGFYLDPLLTFHGIKLQITVAAGYAAENSDGGEYSSGEESMEFNLVLMHEYEGSFEDSNGKKIQFYLT
ncbi:hypothetical protein [Flavobacterium sp. CF136]|uniref:hypothetical protein n=1 Tax=Flavobacterium sp. (strain CF136) TaxID=1144313 RepID=UPI0002718DB5|nr:hypothetical protein [Flavobacterium sp. CF136]EJL66533.1 hypothetical protein PMI10_00582 [Flavobacterium sp. CF136]